MVKLSEIERDVIAEATIGADRSVASIARAIKRKEHSVRDALDRLFETEVIKKVWLFDVLQLGLLRFQVFLSIANRGGVTRGKVAEIITKDPRVSFFADIGGDYDHEFVVLCRNPSQLTELFERISEECDGVIRKKEIGIQDTLHIFGRKHLSQRIATRKHVVLGGRRSKISLDERDHLILKSLQSQPNITKKALAEICDVSVVTIDSRMKLLQSNKVILGASLRVDSAKIGLQNVKLILTASNFSRASKERLLEFVTKNPFCTNFRECISTADYEIGVEFSEPSQLRKLKEELLERFDSHLTHIDVIPRFRIHKYAMYPFQTYRQLAAE